MLMKKIAVTIMILLAVCLLYSSPSRAEGAFFYMGKGTLKIARNNGKLQSIKFRNADGTYVTEGLKKINALYGSDWGSPEARMSLRLIELLDYLEDHFGGKGVRIISGYRSPARNESLRNSGKPAASSSMHLDAEATDIIMEGVASSTISDYLIPKNCCGVGFYHGKAIHIDTGPPRFWDETTSGTETKEPPENKFIIIETKSDIYGPEQKIGLQFSRVNEYPIGVEKTMELICNDGHVKKELRPEFQPTVADSGKCLQLKDRKEGRTIAASIPGLSASKGPSNCQIRARFCEPMTAKMPKFVDSNRFMIDTKNK